MVDNSVRNSRDVIISLVAEWFLDDKHLRQAKIESLSNKPVGIETKMSGVWAWAYDYYRNIIYVKIPE